MKFFCNIEHWADRAFSRQILTKGWRLSAAHPWNLRQFLAHYPGLKYLEAIEDYPVICDVFPQLVLLAHGAGILHKSSVFKFLKEWIYSVQVRTLTLEARYILLTDELKREDIEDLNYENMGTMIITHPMTRERMRAPALRVADRRREEETRKREEEINNISKAAKETEKAEEILACVRKDVVLGRRARDNGISTWSDETTWVKYRLDELKIAFKILIPDAEKPKPQPKKKLDVITALKVHFDTHHP